MNPEQQKIYEEFVQLILNDQEFKETQNAMAIEEALEFSLAILHGIRGKSSREDLISEIADLENMIGQIKAVHKITEEEVSYERIRKIERAKSRKFNGRN